MTLGAAIGIICKTPHPGRSKTRLVPILGARGAAELAAAFLRDIATAIEMVPAAVGRRGYAVYAPQGSEADLRPHLPADFGLLCRRDATLGIVLLSATEHFLAQGHDGVLLVNADSPSLPPLLLAAALAALRAPGDRAVIGPATVRAAIPAPMMARRRFTLRMRRGTNVDLVVPRQPQDCE